jgi:hypothetical protein
MATHSPPPPAAFYQQIIAESGIISIFLEMLLRHEANEEYCFSPSPNPSPSITPSIDPSVDLPSTSSTTSYHDSTQAEILKSLCAFAEYKANLVQLYSGVFMFYPLLLFLLFANSSTLASFSLLYALFINIGSILRVIAYVLAIQTHTAIALELLWKVLEAIHESRTGPYIGPIIRSLSVCVFVFVFVFV